MQHRSDHHLKEYIVSIRIKKIFARSFGERVFPETLTQDGGGNVPGQQRDREAARAEEE
jgi:hypothetical protein